MVTLPDAWKQYNQTTRNFREQYTLLPSAIQRATKDACLLFHQNRDHLSLRRHLLEDRRTGSHRPGSFSVAITMQYRAIYVEDDGISIWYWIGTLRTVTRRVSEDERRFLADASGYDDPLLAFCATL